MFLERNWGKISYRTSGKRTDKAVVFIHGFPFDKSMWDEQERLISRDHFPVTFDIRGHGESDCGTGQYLIEFFVDDLLALMDHLQIESACVCGLSMGGYTALRAIEREPSRFSGLILCDTRSTPDSNAAKLNRANQINTILSGHKKEFADAQVKALFAPESFERNGGAVEKIRKTIESTEDTALVGALIALASRMDMTDSLGRITVPTLIIVGEKDKVTPPADAEMMRSRIANSEMVVMPGAGHLSNLENAKEFNTALTKFLAAHNL